MRSGKSGLPERLTSINKDVAAHVKEHPAEWWSPKKTPRSGCATSPVHTCPHALTHCARGGGGYTVLESCEKLELLKDEEGDDAVRPAPHEVCGDPLPHGKCTLCAHRAMQCAEHGNICLGIHHS
jgi:hypothetical protein